MFIGHFAVGLGLKRVAPALSLGTLFLGVQFLDLLWPTLLLAGIERVEIVTGGSGPPLRFTHYPISHSLLLAVGWGVLIGALCLGVRRSWRAAFVVFAAVLSHWWLDVVVHLPDLPLTLNGTARVGMSLWQSPAWSLALELVMFAVGCGLYLRQTRASDRIGSLGFWSLAAFLLLIQLANNFGSPPPNVSAVAWVGQAQWLIVAWAYWIDAHRHVRASTAIRFARK